MKDAKKPEFDTDNERAPTAEDVRAAQVAAIRKDREEQAAVDTRFDASKYQRKEQR